MAKVTLVPAPNPIPPPPMVHLELTYREAAAIKAVLGAISGPAEGTIREITDDLYYAIGGNINFDDYGFVTADVSGSLRSVAELPDRPR